MHVVTCLETSRDVGSNPPASSLRPPLWSADEACRGVATLVAKPDCLLKRSAMLRATTWQASLLCTGMTYYHVYILRSTKYPDRHYTGFTENLDARVKEHNQGKCVHTSKYVPWEIKTTLWRK